MHRYQPRTHLIQLRENQSFSSVADLTGLDYKTFIFAETVFTAVTAYQNQLVSCFEQLSSCFDSKQLLNIEILFVLQQLHCT